jgi:hypothetical protein
VGGLLLDSLNVEYNKHAFERVGEYECDYGLAGASSGGTVCQISLIKLLAIVCCIIVLLEVVYCTGYMATGSSKDGTFIANEMCTQCD